MSLHSQTIHCTWNNSTKPISGKIQPSWPPKERKGVGLDFFLNFTSCSFGKHGKISMNIDLHRSQITMLLSKSSCMFLYIINHQIGLNFMMSIAVEIMMGSLCIPFHGPMTLRELKPPQPTVAAVGLCHIHQRHDVRLRSHSPCYNNWPNTPSTYPAHRSSLTQVAQWCMYCLLKHTHINQTSNMPHTILCFSLCIVFLNEFSVILLWKSGIYKKQRFCCTYQPFSWQCDHFDKQNFDLIHFILGKIFAPMSVHCP